MSMENGTIYNPFLIDSWEGYPLLLLRFHNHILFIFLIGNAFFFPLWRAQIHLYCSVNINGISQRWIISVPAPEHSVNETTYISSLFQSSCFTRVPALSRRLRKVKSSNCLGWGCSGACASSLRHRSDPWHLHWWDEPWSHGDQDLFCPKSKRAAGWGGIQLWVHAAVSYPSIMNWNALWGIGAYSALTWCSRWFEQIWDAHMLKHNAENVSAGLWTFIVLSQGVQEDHHKIFWCHDNASAVEVEQSRLTPCCWGGGRLCCLLLHGNSLQSAWRLKHWLWEREDVNAMETILLHWGSAVVLLLILLIGACRGSSHSSNWTPSSSLGRGTWPCRHNFSHCLCFSWWNLTCKHLGLGLRQSCWSSSVGHILWLRPPSLLESSIKTNVFQFVPVRKAWFYLLNWGQFRAFSFRNCSSRKDSFLMFATRLCFSFAGMKPGKMALFVSCSLQSARGACTALMSALLRGRGHHILLGSPQPWCTTDAL